MRIDRLRIENFRRFKLVDLELPDGVTALVGRNGAGKSTLLEAIGWVLFGNDAARTQKDLIKRRGAAASDDVRVHMAFRMGPHVYEVTRTLAGKSESPSATVLVDGKLVVPGGARSADEATAYLQRAFHMDRAAFFTSIVARQRELAALSDARPAERKRILIGLLRLDAVDRAIEAARAQRRDARAELVGLRAGLAEEAPLRTALAQTRAKLEADGARIVEIEALVKALEEQVEDLRQRRGSERKVAEEHRGILAEIAALDERLARTRADHARRSVELTRARAAAAEAAQLAPQIEALPEARERVETLTARAEQAKMLAQVRAELSRATREAAVAQKEMEEARAALVGGPELRAEIESVTAERAAKEAHVVALQKRVTSLHTQATERARLVNEIADKEARVKAIGREAPCPTCTRPLREHYEVLLRDFAADSDALRAALAHAAPELDAVRKQTAAAQQVLSDLNARLAALQARFTRFATEETRAGAAAARLADATARAARFREQEAALAASPFDPKELDVARHALRTMEEAQRRHSRALAEAEREKEIVPILAELAGREAAEVAQRADADGRRAALAFDAAAHEALERATQQAEDKLQATRLARERALGDRLRREDEERRLVAQLAAHEALAARIAAAEARMRLLGELAGDRDGGLLPEFKDHLIGRIRPILSLHAGRLFRELCEGRYADLEVDADYDLLVHDEGKAFPLARFSGGEADLANLCLRLAVSQVVAERAGCDGFHFLALDEIFGSQDEIRKGNILRTLATLSGRFRQILLVTHIADVKETAEHVLRVEALDDGTSRVVVEG